MLIISVRDNENNRWKGNENNNSNNNNNNKKTEKARGDRSYSERVRAKLFCCVFKLGFVQLICKASSVFKSNLDLALSIILNQRELYQSDHDAVECRCLKLWDLLSLLIYSSTLVLKQQQILPI